MIVRRWKKNKGILTSTQSFRSVHNHWSWKHTHIDFCHHTLINKTVCWLLCISTLKKPQFLFAASNVFARCVKQQFARCVQQQFARAVRATTKSTPSIGQALVSQSVWVLIAAMAVFSHYMHGSSRRTLFGQVVTATFFSGFYECASVSSRPIGKSTNFFRVRRVAWH